jgi:uncharacterized membrane protein YkvA (DUF1232 family)
VPWSAKLLAGAVAAYALSPIDLIPDFIPVLGLLDDLLIVPVGIYAAVRLIPGPIMEDLRAQALTRDRPMSRAGAGVVIALWLLAAVGAAWLVWRR